MTTRDFEPCFGSTAEEAADLGARVKALAESAEAKALLRWELSSKEDDNEANAVDFLTKAQALRVPARCWFIGESRFGASPMLLLASRAHFQKGLDKLLDAGATAWPACLRHGAAIFCSPSDVALSIFPPSGSGIGAKNRQRALRSALAGLGGLPSERVDEFFVELGRRFGLAVAAGSATSSGALGAGDKNAKICAQTVVDGASSLIAAGQTHAPERLAGVNNLIQTANAIVEAKSRKAKDGFDPVQLKKELTPERKARLKTLCLLAEQCSGDDEALSLLLEKTPWLAQHPQLLCMNVKTSSSFALAALANASLSGALALDRVGANVWLAAAQAGQGNAVLWMCQLLRPRPRQDPRAKRLASMHPLAARLLAYGAFLDGASDPVAHVLNKMDQALRDTTLRYRDAIDAEVAQQLRAQIEKLALSDLLAGRASDSNASATSGSRRRGAL
jgi:hypothetical protein